MWETANLVVLMGNLGSDASSAEVNGGDCRRVPDGDGVLLAQGGRDLLATRGDPMGALRRTCLSAARLAECLQAEGRAVSERSMNWLLHALGYSLQANCKTPEGRQNADRDGQFRYIDERARELPRAGQPVASVGAKKNLGL